MSPQSEGEWLATERMQVTDKVIGGGSVMDYIGAR